MKAANAVDEFFSNRKNLSGKNGTNFRISNFHLISEERKSKNETNFKFNLRVPTLQKRLQFSLEKKSEDVDSKTPIPNSTLQTESGKKEDALRAGLSYFQKLSKVDAKITTGIKLENKIIPFLNLRLEKRGKNGNWGLRTIANIFHNTKDKFGQTLTIDFDRVLDEKFLFRFAFEETYLAIEDQINYAIGPTLFQTFSSSKRISYSFRTISITEPSVHVSEYIMSSTFRKDIYKQFLYFEFTPFSSWSKAQSFRNILGCLAKVELIFGE